MFVYVGFAALNAEKTMPVVPKDAVQDSGQQRYVFAATEKSGEFSLRPVKLAPESNGFYPVIDGLRVGDRIVTEGSFMLRAEWLKTHPSQ